MKCLSVFFFILSFTSATLFAQTHSSPKAEAKPWGLTSTLTTADEGSISILTTKKSYGKGEGDILLSKTDREGNEVWFQSYGGSSYDLASSVSQTKDGGYILIGSTSSFGAGNYDAYVIKTDAKGNKEWSQTYGGFYNEYGQTIEEKANGGYLLKVAGQRFITEKEATEKSGLIWTVEIDKKGKEVQ